MPGLVRNLALKNVDKELSEHEKDLLYLFRMKVWMILLRSWNN